jgi:hypothetical protein
MIVSCPLDRSRVIYGNSSIKEADSQEGLAEQEISEKEDCSKERGGQENCHAIQAQSRAWPVDARRDNSTKARRTHGPGDWRIYTRHDAQSRAHAEPV